MLRSCHLVALSVLFGAFSSGCLFDGKTDEFDARSTSEPGSDTDEVTDSDDAGAGSDGTDTDGTATEEERTDDESTDGAVDSTDAEPADDERLLEPEEGCDAGDERCTCYPNDTCNDDLTCLSGLCVDASALGSDVPNGDPDATETDPGEGSDDTPAAMTLENPANDELPPPPPGTNPIPVDDTPAAAAVADGTIGSSCESDTDCASGFRCMESGSSEWLNGGPAGGYCTRNCVADPAVCSAAGSVCIQVTEDEAYCVEGCSVGASADKCHGRGDVACDAASIGVGFCRPMCRSDADCGDRHCDVGSGACFDDAFPGDPIGAACDPGAEESTCATGVCLPITDAFAVCTGFCNLSEVGCGSDDPTPVNPGEPMCTFAAVDGSGPQDLGFCNQRCDCDDDCLHPDGLCLILPSDVQAVTGTAGLCVDPDFPLDDPTFTLGRACAN